MKIRTPIYKDDTVMGLSFETIYVKKDTNHQSIILGKEIRFGRMLLLDSIVQTSELDHEIYDEAMTCVVSESTEKVLILGGGDLYVARYLIEKKCVKSVVVVDLDEELVKMCRSYLHDDKAFLNQIEIVYSDVLDYLKGSSELFDSIIVDLTDCPIGSEELEETINFYKDLFVQMIPKVKDGGCISIQCGADETNPPYQNLYEVVENISLKYPFREKWTKSVFVPSFGEKSVFKYIIK